MINRPLAPVDPGPQNRLHLLSLSVCLVSPFISHLSLCLFSTSILCLSLSSASLPCLCLVLNCSDEESQANWGAISPIWSRTNHHITRTLRGGSWVSKLFIPSSFFCPSYFFPLFRNISEACTSLRVATNRCNSILLALDLFISNPQYLLALRNPVAASCLQSEKVAGSRPQ